MRPNARSFAALVGALVLVGFTLRSAFADPPPWAPAHGWRKHHEHDDDDDDWWRDHDREEWKHHHYKHHKDDARCAQILDRIHFNRSKIREIEPTGRHRKALQWYKDDNVNAERDLDRCRRGE